MRHLQDSSIHLLARVDNLERQWQHHEEVGAGGALGDVNSSHRRRRGGEGARAEAVQAKGELIVSMNEALLHECLSILSILSIAC